MSGVHFKRIGQRKKLKLLSLMLMGQAFAEVRLERTYLRLKNE